MNNDKMPERNNHHRTEDIVFFIPDFRAKMNSLIIPHKAGVSLPDPEYFIRRVENWFTVNGYVLEYVISGKGYIEYQDTVYPVKEGDFYLINRGVYCCYKSDPDDPYRKIWINGVGRLFNALIYAFNLNSPVLIVSCPASYDCFLRIHEILKKCNNDIANVHLCEAELTEEITKLFIEVARACKHINVQWERTFVDFEEILRFVRDNITNWNLGVDFIARSFFISRVALYRLFKKNIGISPQKYIEESKIEYAKNAFLFSNHTIAEVAHILHYRNTRCFGLAFKRVEGISPTEWKRWNISGS